MWYMGSEYNVYDKQRTLEITHTQFVRNGVERFGITKSNPITSSPSLDLKHASNEAAAVDAGYREIVGSLMWITNETTPDIANAVPAVARFSHAPTEVRVKAARKIKKYLGSTANLGLTFRKNIYPEEVQSEYGLETYADADTSTRATIGVRSLVWLYVAGVHLWCGFLLRRRAPPCPLSRRGT